MKGHDLYNKYCHKEWSSCKGLVLKLIPALQKWWLFSNLCWAPAYCYLCFFFLRITKMRGSGLTWGSEDPAPQWKGFAGLGQRMVLFEFAFGSALELLTFCIREPDPNEVGAVLCIIGTFSSILGLYPLDTSRNLSSSNNLNYLWVLSDVPQWDRMNPSWEALRPGGLKVWVRSSVHGSLLILHFALWASAPLKEWPFFSFHLPMKGSDD